MIRKGTTFILAVLCTALLGCPQSTSQTDGTVLINITNSDGIPVNVSAGTAVNTNGGLVQLGTITIASIVKDPSGTSSALMAVNIESYQVTFDRADTGTRTPAKLVRGIFGALNPGGTVSFDNLPIMTNDQLQHQPLKDLLIHGYDTETNSQVIVLNVQIVFFGRTLAGEAVKTPPANFTVDVTP